MQETLIVLIYLFSLQFVFKDAMCSTDENERYVRKLEMIMYHRCLFHTVGLFTVNNNTNV